MTDYDTTAAFHAQATHVATLRELASVIRLGINNVQYGEDALKARDLASKLADALDTLHVHIYEQATS